MPELPPITAKLEGEIADFLAKMEAVKKAIQGVKDEARKGALMKIVTRYELGKSVPNSANPEIRAMFRDLVKEAEKAGRDSGISYRQAFNKEFAKIKEDQKSWPSFLPAIGAALPLIPAVGAGAAGIVGGLATAGVGAAAGLGALYASMKSALGPVTSAYSTIDSAANGIAANATALQTWLKGSSVPKGTSKPLTPAQQAVIQTQIGVYQSELASAGGTTKMVGTLSPAQQNVIRTEIAKYQAQLAGAGGTTTGSSTYLRYQNDLRTQQAQLAKYQADLAAATTPSARTRYQNDITGTQARITNYQALLAATSPTKTTGTLSPTSIAHIQALIAADQARLAGAGGRPSTTGVRNPASIAHIQALIAADQARLAAGTGGASLVGNSLGPGLSFLTNPNVNWYTLTKAQQSAVVMAAQSTTGMPTSEKAQISALMKERQAYLPLDPAQQQMLFRYTNFQSGLSNALGASEPQALGVASKGLAAVTPALKYIAPLAQTAAKALNPLLDKLAKGINSKGFGTFVGYLEKMATLGISGFGKAFGDFAVGLGRMFEGFASSGTAKTVVNDLVEMADHFKNWTGGAGFKAFMDTVKRDTPILDDMLKNLQQILFKIIGSLNTPLGQAEFKALSMIVSALNALLHIPGIGTFIANFIAIQLILSKTRIAVVELAAVKALWKWLSELSIVKNVTKWFNDLWTTLSGKAIGALKSLGSSMVSGIKTAALWSAQMVVRMATAVAAWVAGLLGIDSATAASSAFIIAASGGVLLLLAGLAVGIYELYKHWNTVWSWITKVSKDAWTAISQGWDKYIAPYLYKPGFFQIALDQLSKYWGTVWSSMKDVGTNFYNWFYHDFGDKIYQFLVKNVPSWFDTAVHGISVAWNKIKDTVEVPVKFIIDTVLDGLINSFDSITNAVGLGKPIPVVHPFGLKSGGRLPGFGGGDVLPALLEPGETVVDKQRTQKYAWLFKLMGVPGFAGGGVVGNPFSAIGNFFGSAASDIGNFIGKGWDLAKIATAMATGNSVALTNAFASLLGQKPPNTGGVLANILTAIPHMLVNDVVNWLIGSSQASNVGGSANVSQYANTALTVLRMLGQPSSDLSTVLTQMNTESAGNINAVNRTDINWQNGTPSVGLMQVIAPTFRAFAGPFANTGPFLYGVSTNPLANIFAGLNYATQRYGAGWTSVLGHGHGYSAGGVIPEPVLGLGLSSGDMYTFAERGQETVIPGVPKKANSWQGAGKGGDVYVTVNTNEINPRYNATMLGFELARRSG